MLSIAGDRFLMNGSLFEMWGIRAASGTMRQAQMAADRPGLSVFFHSNSWCQDTGNRCDLGGDGTPDNPGIRWYFEAVAQARGMRI